MNDFGHRRLLHGIELAPERLKPLALGSSADVFDQIRFAGGRVPIIPHQRGEFFQNIDRPTL